MYMWKPAVVCVKGRPRWVWVRFRRKTKKEKITEAIRKAKSHADTLKGE